MCPKVPPYAYTIDILQVIQIVAPDLLGNLILSREGKTEKKRDTNNKSRCCKKLNCLCRRQVHS